MAWKVKRIRVQVRRGWEGRAAGRNKKNVRKENIYDPSIYAAQMWHGWTNAILLLLFFIPETDGYIPVLKHLNKIHKMLALLVHSFAFFAAECCCCCCKNKHGGQMNANGIMADGLSLLGGQKFITSAIFAWSMVVTIELHFMAGWLIFMR